MGGEFSGYNPNTAAAVFSGLPEVKEILGNTLPRPELINFLVGAAFIGNDSYTIQNGMLDSRSYINSQEAHKITLLGLIQLMKVANGIESIKSIPESEHYKVMGAFYEIFQMAKSTPFEFAEGILGQLENWATKMWSGDWPRLDRMHTGDHEAQTRMLNMMNTMPDGKRAQYFGLEGPIFLSADFVGNRFGTITRNLLTSVNPPQVRYWDRYDDLVRFRKPYLRKTEWQKITGAIATFHTGKTSNTLDPDVFMATLR